MATVGLCMIVKNEAHVITRCLDSVRPLLDFVLIEDTGSTDGTQAVIREWLHANQMSGEVVDVPWRDFAWNRSHALQLLRGHAQVDYALVIDADDQLVVEPGFDAEAFKRDLVEDVLDVEIRHGPIRYQRPHLLRNSLPFVYRGVLHEYIEMPSEARRRALARGYHMAYLSGGARSLDTQKFVRDATVLAQALRSEADPFLRTRYTFYLAQSYRDADQPAQALETYLSRSSMGGWAEEVFVSLYQAAKLRERLGHAAQEVLNTYLMATAAQPDRAEALHGASRYCRVHKRYEQGYWLARRGLGPQPAQGLFVEPWIYDYGLLDELAVNAYWSGRYAESVDACTRLLEVAELPGGMRERVAQNLNFAQKRMQAESALVVSTP